MKLYPRRSRSEPPPNTGLNRTGTALRTVLPVRPHALCARASRSVGEQKHLSVLNIEVKTMRLPLRKECNMNRWLITPSVLAVALAASAPLTADTQGRGEGG